MTKLQTFVQTELMRRYGLKERTAAKIAVVWTSPMKSKPRLLEQIQRVFQRRKKSCAA